MEKVQLTIDGSPAGECDFETFELAKLYLAEGKNRVDVIKELIASGLEPMRAMTIVVNAKRELKQGW